MIKELVEFGKRISWGQERAIVKESCVMLISIDENGEFLGFIHYDKEIKAEVLVKYDKKKNDWGYLSAKKGQVRFLLDKSDAVLGIGDKDAENKHKMFLRKLYSYDSVQALKPVFLFYKEDGKGLKKAIEEFKKLDKTVNGNISFMVNTTPLLEMPEVQKAIIERFHETENNLFDSLRHKKVCSVCGKTNNPVLDEPYGLVKMPKGQTAGCALVSFNESAFESYGLKGNLNASLCRECARNLTEALSFMLSKGNVIPKTEKREVHYKYRHRIKISDTTVALFWTREMTNDDDSFFILDEPDEENVRNLLKSAWTGDQRLGSVVDTNMFYSCTLSSAAARIAVRDWTAISLDDYKHNLADWFHDIEIQNEAGTLAYNPLRILINATQRNKKNGENKKTDLSAKSRIGAILWNAAVKGKSYKIPIEVLQYTLNRIFVGEKISDERAAVIKLVINRNTNKNMESKLDEKNRSVAYLCGRLFAVIETMQWKAVGDVNNGVKERYFTAAASQPAYIIGMLLTKNVPIYQHKIGGYLAKELNEIAGNISERGSLPLRFSVIEQGEFALGYYFQRNHKKDTTESNN